jgi:ankyrin repeat protein
MNKWTALHWAAKRNNPEIVKILVENGAEKLVENDKGEIALQLTTSDEVRALLGGRVEEKTIENVISSETTTSRDNDVTAVRDVKKMLRVQSNLCRTTIRNLWLLLTLGRFSEVGTYGIKN